MAQMKEVETAVGKDNLLTLSLQTPDKRNKLS